MTPFTLAPFTLAHLSDPHLAPLPKPRLIELAGKRAFGYVNWTRNRHKYQRREVLDALVADMKAQAPDHIAVTGDLVNLALEAEFAPALAWLESVGPPDRVTAIPGNHDAYVSATRHRFGETFLHYIAADTPGGAAFPAVRRRGPLALISLSTAVPTLPLMATGTLGRDQLAALAEVLERLAAEDVFRVLLVHHPLKSSARAKSRRPARHANGEVRPHCRGISEFGRRGRHRPGAARVWGGTARPGDRSRNRPRPTGRADRRTGRDRPPRRRLPPGPEIGPGDPDLPGHPDPFERRARRA
jgi:hypothetical protein